MLWSLPCMEEPIASNSIVIFNRWASINTFQLYKDRKGLRFRPLIWCEKTAIPNPLPTSQGHLPFLTLGIADFKSTEKQIRPTNVPGFRQTHFWLSDQVCQARNGQEMPSLLISTMSLFSPLKNHWKFVYENVYVPFFYIYAHIFIINTLLVATGNLL